MRLKAIDISGNNTIADYGRLKKAGVECAVIKCTQGKQYSSAFEKHLRGCLDAGISNIGTYSYIVATSVSEAREHARYAVDFLAKYKGKINMPVFADMEDAAYEGKGYGKASRTKIMLAFLDEIDKAGYYPAIYINPAWLENHIDKAQILGKYDVWLAAWTQSPDNPTRYDYGQTMWQWGLDKSLGVPGGVDGDIVYVDYPSHIRGLGKNFLDAPAKVDVKPTAHYYSYGTAAMRAEPTSSAPVVRRCEKGVIYPIAEIVRKSGKAWLKHVDGTYSMEADTDGRLLFARVIPCKTTARVNVREQPNGRIVCVYENGSAVSVIESGNEWSKIIHDKAECYMASAYIKAVK